MIKISIILCVIVFHSFVANAQNESGTRYLNQTRFQQQHLWYDSTTQMFQQAFPIIRNFPPINTGMPIDILLGYIYLDSLLKSSTNHTLDSMLNTMNSSNDTLKYALKYLYRLVDYYPVIFKQYANEINFYQNRGPRKIKIIGATGDTLSPTVGPYSVNLIKLKSKIEEKFKDVFLGQSKLAYYSMFLADYILRVHIINIDSILCKNVSSSYYRYNVTASIIDTLKGKVIPVVSLNNQTKKNIEKLTGLDYLFNFQFTPYNYGMLYVTGAEPLYSKQDTSFSDSWKFKMKTGQEAIVFITLDNQLYDYQRDYYDFDLEPRCSLNALKIENENVYDINNVWSNQTIIPYQNWKQIFSTLQNNIKNITY